MKKQVTPIDANNKENGGAFPPKVSGQNLRQRAEKSVKMAEILGTLPPEEIRQALHQLQVHQIELEMQNEELQRTHVELDALRARYFDLYDLAPVGYLTVSKQGLILEVNLTAATMLGVARSALLKRQLTRFILKEDQDIYYMHRKQLFETNAPQKCELRLVKIDGTAFWALLDATAAEDSDGAPVCRVVLSDISVQKQTEETIRKLNEDLEQKVNERTAELKKTVSQLEELNRAFVGRELKMVELKERIAELEKQKT